MLHARDAHLATPLHVACAARGRLASLREILAAIEDPGQLLVAKDVRGRTPLHVACAAGFSEAVSLLAVLGASAAGDNVTAVLLATCDAGGQTPADLARASGKAAAADAVATAAESAAAGDAGIRGTRSANAKSAAMPATKAATVAATTAATRAKARAKSSPLEPPLFSTSSAPAATAPLRWLATREASPLWALPLLNLAAGTLAFAPAAGLVVVTAMAFARGVASATAGSTRALRSGFMVSWCHVSYIGTFAALLPWALEAWQRWRAERSMLAIVPVLWVISWIGFYAAYMVALTRARAEEARAAQVIAAGGDAAFYALRARIAALVTGGTSDDVGGDTNDVSNNNGNNSNNNINNDISSSNTSSETSYSSSNNTARPGDSLSLPDVTRKLCLLCMSKREKDSQHCFLCGRCTGGVDHHCVFFDSCIGARNHVPFLAYVSLLLAYVVLWLGIYWAHICAVVPIPPREPDSYAGGDGQAAAAAAGAEAATTIIGTAWQAVAVLWALVVERDTAAYAISGTLFWTHVYVSLFTTGIASLFAAQVVTVSLGLRMGPDCIDPFILRSRTRVGIRAPRGASPHVMSNWQELWRASVSRNDDDDDDKEK
jgi:hypothetical protein